LRGVWLGIAEDIEADTPDQSARLERGDILLLYTDRLIEARSATNEEFGIERVEQALRSSAHGGRHDLRESAERHTLVDSRPAGRRHLDRRSSRERLSRPIFVMTG
jgi:serine phosphatase RsbU (regulator of sigma subunit)